MFMECWILRGRKDFKVKDLNDILCAPIFQLDFPPIVMEGRLSLASKLNKQPFISLPSLIKQHQNLSQKQILSEVIQHYHSHQSEVDLLCSVVFEQQGAVRIQYLQFSSLSDNTTKNSWQIKQCQVAALITKTLDHNEAIDRMQKECIPKTKKYQAKGSIIELNQVQKTQFTSKDEVKKGKTLQKQQKQLSQKEPISKVAKKLQPLPKKQNSKVKKIQTPVLTGFQQARAQLDKKIEKVEAPKEEKKNRKMDIESEQEIYDNKAFAKMMGTGQFEEDNGKQTDSSAKKKQNEDILAKKVDQVKRKVFDAEDEDDQEELFAKFNEIKPNTQPEVKVQPKTKPAPVIKSQPSAPIKGGIKGWLTKK